MLRPSLILSLLCLAMTVPPRHVAPPVLQTKSSVRADIYAIQRQRWTDASIRPEKIHYVTSIRNGVLRGRSRYESVALRTKVPWQVIGVLHNMECGLSFRQHLHNGDSLNGYTHNVPAGRPPGHPPFRWEASAVDALRYDHLDRRFWNDTPVLLQNIETFNGTGYQKFHPTIPTPYLWSWTTVYTRGKYVSDGRWDPMAVSMQCGVVPLLKTLP